MSTDTARGAHTAIGPTLELDMAVSGVAAIATVDTGSKSSTIFGQFYTRLGGNFGGFEPAPTLEPASVRLYGKVEAAGQHEINITAQIT